ncbi:MAG: Tol-Pal system beta propeller repeat protein TolB [Proteobacteria bacterium]|nr:Tol-Pal system beta propeller repeat protein TolB [Pseudomonadota bacterium]
MKRSPRAIASIVFLLASIGFVGVDAAVAQERAVVIDIDNPNRILYPIAVPRGVDSNRKLSKQVQAIASFNLGVAGWFNILDPRSFLANLKAEGLGIEVQKWKDIGAFGVMKYQIAQNGDEIEIQFRLYEIEKGADPVLSQTHRGSDVRMLVHRWCNEVVEYFTGDSGFFGSKIAFVRPHRRRGKAIMVMDFDGNGAYKLTRNRSINILPSFSPDGFRVTFTSYMRNNPDLYQVSVNGGRPKRISKHRGMNTGAAWSPDGSKIAVTLSKDGDPEIYLLSADTGEILSRLTRDRAIDASPAWSPTGREIAFVSDREGGPQIFVMNADGSNQRRVSSNGNYNTTPTWSPRKNKRLLAYTTRDGRKHDIVTLDLDSGEMVRITQNQGSNEEPSFSPNGHAIAFASVRRRGGSGIYVVNADGTGKQVRIYKGKVTAVDWGPVAAW